MIAGAGRDAGEHAAVRGPHLVERPDAGAAAGLAALWLAATRAGGAVGFVPDSPEAEVRAAADAVVAGVVAGREQMIVLGAGDAPVGTVFLRPGQDSVVAHRGEVVRLMVHPDRQGRGHGGALLAASADRARALGLELLLLSARGGTALPDYYAARGWTAVGVWPGAIKVADGRRDEHWFALHLA